MQHSSLMYRKNFLSLLCFLASSTLFAQNADFLDYINKYKRLAVSEMNRAGVPASIKLAQALLESNAGRSELARKANNHFGIKCHANWGGKTYELEDDDYDEFGNLKKSCFRKYKDVEDSYIAHSEFLRDPRKANRYGFLFRLETTDYKRWAKGLRTAGYATAAGYDDKLIRLIETYKLHELDKLTEGDLPGGKHKPNKSKDLIAGLDVQRVNDVRVVLAKNNLTVEEISQRSGIPIKRLERYNEKLPSVNTPLANDYRVFLQPKRCAVRGGNKWHYVKAGEDIFTISQEYGVSSKKLRKRNRIPAAAEPQVNQRLKLRGLRIRKGDQPRLTTEPKPTETVPPLDADDGFMQDDDVAPEQPGQPDIVVPDPPTNNTPDVPADGTYHTVAKGDTLYNISRRYGLTVDALKKLNNLTEDSIKIGQKLRIK